MSKLPILDELLEALKKALISWEDVDPELIKFKGWKVVMYFPSFTLKDAKQIADGLTRLGIGEIIEFDTRYVEGDVPFSPHMIPVTPELILGMDDDDSFAVPRAITNKSIDFLFLMNADYWCCYGSDSFLGALVGSTVEAFNARTLESLKTDYTDCEVEIFKSKVTA